MAYLQLAGQQAVQHSANAEAITHLTTALELLKTLPDTPERIQQELTLQIALGPPLAAIKGYAALEVGEVYTRARELCEQIGETPQLLSVMHGQWVFYFARGELQTARELAEQLLTLAQRVQDPSPLLWVYDALWSTLFFLGEFAQARQYYERGIALYDPQQHHSLAFLYSGHDPGVCGRAVAAWVLWLFGYPDQALKRVHEALTLAQELSHPYSLAFALCYGTWPHQFCREGQAVQERAEAVIALSTEQRFSFELAMGTILRGWALAEQGQGAEGIAQIHQGLVAYQATGTELHRSYFLALLAEAYGKVGQAEEGLAVLAEALAMVDKTGERFYEAELYRLQGELTLQSCQLSVVSCQCTKPQLPIPNPQGGSRSVFS